MSFLFYVTHALMTLCLLTVGGRCHDAQFVYTQHSQQHRCMARSLTSINSLHLVAGGAGGGAGRRRIRIRSTARHIILLFPHLALLIDVRVSAVCSALFLMYR